MLVHTTTKHVKSSVLKHTMTLRPYNCYIDRQIFGCMHGQVDFGFAPNMRHRVNLEMILRVDHVRRKRRVSSCIFLRE